MRSGAQPFTRFGREGHWSTSSAGIASGAHAGSTVAYAYFPDREAVFRTAADQDVSRVIREELAAAVASAGAGPFFRAIADVLDRHPPTRRLCAGLEPEVTSRVPDNPALTELRNPVPGLRTDQLNSTARPHTDPVAIASGIVAVMLFLPMPGSSPGMREVSTAPASGP